MNSQRLMEWLAEAPESAPKLSAMPEGEGERGVQIETSDYVVTRYINGKALHRLRIVLQYVADWSGGTDGVNQRSAAIGERWQRWVSRQWPGNPPDIGTVVRLEPVNDAPTIAMVYQDEGLARYQFAVEIDYRD
nr:MAG TPA: Minor capsid protein from bacteriophage [Caudoviricetes sp.]